MSDIYIDGNGEPSDPVVKAWNAEESLFEVVSTEYPIIVTGAYDEEEVYLDAIQRAVSDATIKNGWLITAPGQSNVSFSSVNTAKATVSSNGVVTPVTSFGIAQINVSTRRGTIGVEVPVSIDTAQETVSYLRHVSGTLGHHCDSNIDSRVNGLEATGIRKALFSVFDHSLSHYTYNPQCWMYDVDVTGIAVWNSNSGSAKQGGIMVTPRHFVMAKHYKLPAGKTIRFAGRNGEICNRTVTAGFDSPDSDWYLGRLDSDVDSFVKIHKVMPSDFLLKMPTVCSLYPRCIVPYPVAGLYIDQFRNSYVSHWMSDYPTTAGSSIIRNSIFDQVRDSTLFPYRTAFSSTPILYDSGGPIGVIVNNEFVLVATWTTTAGGPAYRYYRDEINNAINSLGSSGGHQIQTVDLSSFPSF